jgi:hypothetical protein
MYLADFDELKQCHAGIIESGESPGLPPADDGPINYLAGIINAGGSTTI